MNSILLGLKALAIGIAATISGFFGAHQAQNLGATNPVSPAVFETYLASQQATGDTTLTLASGTLRDGTSLSGYVCLTIDANTSSLEYECGTANGTSVTGIQRGIDAATGTTTISSLIFTHRRGADVKITDYPTLTIINNQMRGIESISSTLFYASHPSFSQNTQIVDKQYVDQTAFGSTPVITNSGGTGLTNSTLPVNAMLVYPGSGNIFVSTSTPTFAAITATSTTATSTFAGGVTIGKSATVAGNITITGDTTINGTLFATVSVAPFGLFGNAADGNCTYSGTVNLTQDVYCGTITVNSGATVYTNGWRMFATSTVSVSGTISAVGKPGTNGVSGTTVAGGAAGGAATSTGLLGTAGAGLAGSNSNSGSVSRPTAFADSIGGSGGAGGLSSATGQTSLGGVATSTMARFLNVPDIFSLTVYSTSTSAYVRATAGNGGGGGGGGSGDSGGGGGGGGGGGIVAIFAPTISVAASGIITANGGVGGAGGTNNGSGGGGGGGGAVVIGYTSSYTNSGSVTANGGNGGALAGGGSNGVAGSNGRVIILKFQ